MLYHACLKYVERACNDDPAVAEGLKRVLRHATTEFRLSLMSIMERRIEHTTSEFEYRDIVERETPTDGSNFTKT